MYSCRVFTINLAQGYSVLAIYQKLRLIRIVLVVHYINLL